MLSIAKTALRRGSAAAGISTRTISRLSKSLAENSVAAMPGRNFAVCNRVIFPGILRRTKQSFSLFAWHRRVKSLCVLAKTQPVLPPRERIFIFVQVPKQKTDSHSVAQSSGSSVAAGTADVFFPRRSKHLEFEWDSRWLAPAPLVKTTVRPVPLDEVRLQRIKKTSQGHRGVWEIDAFFTPSPVDGDNRPFFPLHCSAPSVIPA